MYFIKIKKNDTVNDNVYVIDDYIYVRDKINGFLSIGGYVNTSGFKKYTLKFYYVKIIPKNKYIPLSDIIDVTDSILRKNKLKKLLRK